MADYVIPVKNVAFIYYGSLVSQADTKLFKSGPTLATGDFKVSIDGGAFANLATLPTNTPGTFAVKFSLSTSEMNGDNILVVASDAAGAEWCDQCWNIQTAARGVADLAYPATSGRSMVVDAAGLVDANVVKLGPTGSGTAQTARDVGGNVDVAVSTRASLSAQTVRANTCPSAGTTSSIVLDAGASATSSLYNGLWVVLTGGAGAGQARLITAYNGGTQTATVVPNWTTTTDGTTTFAIVPAAYLLGVQGNVSGSVGSVTGNVSGTVASVVGSVASVVGAVGSVTGLTAANLDATISSRAAASVLGTPFGASIAADLAEIEGETDAIQAKTDNLPGSPAAVGSAMTLSAAYDAAKTAAQAGDAMALTAGERNSVADALLDRANAIETAYTVRKALRLMAAVLCGKVSGGPGSPVFRSMDDTADRVTSVATAAGNRTTVTLSP